MQMCCCGKVFHIFKEHGEGSLVAAEVLSPGGECQSLIELGDTPLEIKGSE